jgi:ABC-type microcin C transport system permease subunit YejB
MHGRDYPIMMASLFFLSVLLLVIHGTISLTEPGNP